MRPRTLFVAADGPSPKRPGDAEKCRQARAIVEKVDWKCDLQTRFYPENRGCRTAMCDNINWFFANVTEGMILEDDCLPHPSFFRFCSELLEFYRNDARVMLVCGDNKSFKGSQGSGSYYFSRLVHIWGWATWRRAWAHYDVNISSFPQFKGQKQIRNIFSNPAIQRFWTDHFEFVYQHKLDTWDYQWAYSVFTQGGLSILPRVNLVRNIGFGPDATHTTSATQRDAFLDTEDIGSIVHPRFVIPDSQTDEQIANKFYGVEQNRGIFSGILKRRRFLF